ncbi:hypothetical protein ACEZ3G_01450 [Maribacter algicola]|uniref:Uncharacterized protein n=1 Tax=Meishania litoralis TaxID=3434685 RepID=A0ACC7LG37_9FLAO
MEKLKVLLFVCVSTLCFQPLTANNAPIPDIMDRSMADIVGSWAYDVQNVDPQYAKGILHIEKEKGKYVLNIQGAEGSMIPTEELTVDGSEVKFVVYVEGDRVSITLNFDGDSFSGDGSSSSGPFTLSGKRIPDPK